MHITKLVLTNYRCFPSLKVEFSDKLTVLVAPNGNGKSAVLDALAVALGPFVGAFDDGKDSTFSPDDIRLVRASDGSNTMEIAVGGVALEAFGDIPPGNSPGRDSASGHRSWKRNLAGLKSRTTRKHARVLTGYGKRLQDEVRRESESGTTGTCLPLVAYYDTGRLWNIRRLPYSKLSRTSRMVGYTHCLEPGSDFHLLANWFRYWSSNSWKARIAAQQQGTTPVPTPFDDALEAISAAVDSCLEPSGWKGLDFSMAREEMVIHHSEHGELPVAMLSDGVRSMLGLVADIAFRAAKLNPNLGPFAARETRGIVLIDEVDMHLHPSWQQTVLAQLMAAFPKIQFIVSTHSPQVLSSVKKENIRVLGKNSFGEFRAESPLATSYGEISSDVLQSIMLVDPYPPISERAALKRLIELVDQGRFDTDEAKKLKQDIEQALGKGHPQLQYIERSILRQRKLGRS